MTSVEFIGNAFVANANMQHLSLDQNALQEQGRRVVFLQWGSFRRTSSVKIFSQALETWKKQAFGESLRGNRIGATGLRPSERKSASERVSERVSEREGFQRFLRGFERF